MARWRGDPVSPAVKAVVEATDARIAAAAYEGQVFGSGFMLGYNVALDARLRQQNVIEVRLPSGTVIRQPVPPTPPDIEKERPRPRKYVARDKDGNVTATVEASDIG